MIGRASEWIACWRGRANRWWGLKAGSSVGSGEFEGLRFLADRLVTGWPPASS